MTAPRGECGRRACSIAPVTERTFFLIKPDGVERGLTGTILALSRAIGETAPLLLVGATVFVTYNPDGLLDGAYTVLPVQIFQWAVRPQEEFRILAAAGIIVLLGVLLAMNSLAIWIRQRFTREL